jgi:hypothetical protein
MPKKLKTPAYTRHSSGQARVRVDGQAYYLGQYGTPESREKYEDLVSAWLAKQDPSRAVLTVDDLVLLFTDFAEGYYRHPDGSPTVRCLTSTPQYLVRLYGRTRVRDFGPAQAEAGPASDD